MVIRTLIVEDEDASRSRLRDILASFPQVDVVGECANGTDAVNAIGELHPDLVLLDIELPGMSGMEVVESLSGQHRPAFLFITAHDDFAVHAFDEEAIDYVLKPFSTARVTRALERAFERLQSRNTGSRELLQRFSVRSVNRTYFVPVSEVDWIDVADNYLRLHAGGRSHLVRGTVSWLLDQVDPREFVRINRGLVVRVSSIVSVENIAPATYRLTMKDGAKLTSSRTHAETVRNLL